MKKTLTIMSIVAVILVAVAVPLVHAGQRHSGMHRDMGMGFGPLAHLERAQKALGLSDQQVDAIKAVMAGAREQNAQYRQQLHAGLGEVISTLLKNPNDIAAAQAVVDRQTQVERTLKTNLLQAASQAFNILTPEQREKLGTMMAERRAGSRHSF